MNRSIRPIVARFALLTVLGVSLLMSACGGGSSSSSAGSGSGTGDATSTVLIRLSSFPGSAMRDAPSQDLDGVARIASLLSSVLIRDAWAQTIGANAPVYFNGRLVAYTDVNGAATVAIAPGTYDICFGAPDTYCILGVVVGDSTIVDITDVVINDTTQEVTATVNPRDAELIDYVNYQDPLREHKLIVCHKDKNTISVGGPAISGHFEHGDYLGECAEPPVEVATVGNNGNNGNNGKKPDKTNNGNKPDKGNNGNNSE